MTYKEKVIDLLKRMMADTKKKRGYLERYECSEDVKRLDGGLNFANNYLVALTSIKEDPVPEKIGNKPEGFVVEGKTITINKTHVDDQPQFNLGVDESNVFTEPAESEDERIRKDIIALIKFALKDGSAVSPGSNTTKEEALAYLEKLKEQKPNFDTHWENGSIVCEQKKQKPAEWSEEDLIHLTNAILSAEKEWGIKSCTAKWLKSLPERFNLQPKQEWSELDEQMYEGLMYDLQKLENTGSFPISSNVYEWLKNRFKAIHLIKQEWSEEDENNLNKLLQWDGIPLGLRIWVSGLPEKVGTRPSWKPSEEQMEALHKAIKKAYHDYDVRPLESLYTDLLKLKLL